MGKFSDDKVIIKLIDTKENKNYNIYQLTETVKKEISKLKGLEPNMLVIDAVSTTLSRESLEDFKKALLSYEMSTPPEPANSDVYEIGNINPPSPLSRKSYIPDRIKDLAQNLTEIGLDIHDYTLDQRDALMEYTDRVKATKQKPNPVKTEWCYVIETQEPQPCLWALQGTEENNIFENPGQLDNYLFLYVDNEVDNEVDKSFISECITELYENLKDEFSGVILLPKGFTAAKVIKIRKITE